MINGDVINAEDYGVVADSESAAGANKLAWAEVLSAASANTTIVLQAGKTYWFPTNTTFGAANVTVDGQGATIKQQSGSQTTNWLHVTECNGFQLRNVVIDGNRTGAASLNSDSSLLLVYNVENVNIEYLTIHSSSAKGLAIASGVSGSGTRYIRVSNVTAYDCATQCVITDRSNGGTESPACENITLDKIFVKDTDHAGIAINDGSRRVTVSNCILDVNNTTWDALSIRGSREITVTNVIGRRGRNGCYVYTSDSSAVTRGEKAINVTMSNNIWEINDQAGVLAAGVTGLNIQGDIARNNGQGTSASGFEITQSVAASLHSTYVNLTGVSAFDDQGVAAQDYGINISSSDHVRVTSPLMYGNAVSNKVKLLTVTDTSVVNDSAIGDGATNKKVYVSTGTISGSSSAVVTALFSTAFDYAPNWANAQVLFGSSSKYLRVQQITGIGTTSVQVLVVNDNASSAEGTLYVEAQYLN